MKKLSILKKNQQLIRLFLDKSEYHFTTIIDNPNDAIISTKPSNGLRLPPIKNNQSSKIDPIDK